MAGRRSTSDDRAAARTAKLEALHQRLQEQVAALTSGSDWKAWLDVAARFHSYSFRNTMLILAQRPDATQVAGYNAWQALGRQVLKGERGIQVLAPVTRPRADTEPDDDKERTKGIKSGQGREVVGWRVSHVWDPLSRESGE